MTNHAPEETPADGVSKKLKIFVIILTAVTFLALVALFTKLANKPSGPKKNQSTVQKTISNQSLSDEYQAVGTRLMNSGLKEQAIDQFIKVWEMQKTGSMERAKAAQTVGGLYADLGNCQEALIWLFRAEVSDSTLPLQSLIDSCLAKVRSIHSGQ
ncbi:MAG: hypothetical protein H8E42_05820 [Nitrospinae bacterium]|nr:hypothetical protein [Nitrospinota bacterium]MBL7020113.1 hypothetical protein [Nitrospinaceae bacterium]